MEPLVIDSDVKSDNYNNNLNELNVNLQTNQQDKGQSTGTDLNNNDNNLKNEQSTHDKSSDCNNEDDGNNANDDNSHNDIDERCEINQNDSINNNSNNKRKPDSDSMKMFVGQIPRDWNENDCRKLLEPFGEIYQINIHKDKQTKQSKGCCFVTYYTRKAALDAQNALHNLRKLPSCRNPIQMKPADNENKNDRKLFIGKLPKYIVEQDIVQTMEPYGTVEECMILRDNQGQSRGCAFVTFSTRSDAIKAMRELNQTKIFENCSQPVVVKFADSNIDHNRNNHRQHSSIITDNNNPFQSTLSLMSSLFPATTPAAAVAMNFRTVAAAAAAPSIPYPRLNKHHSDPNHLTTQSPYNPLAPSSIDGVYLNNLIKIQQQQQPLFANLSQPSALNANMTAATNPFSSTTAALATDINYTNPMILGTKQSSLTSKTSLSPASAPPSLSTLIGQISTAIYPTPLTAAANATSPPHIPLVAMAATTNQKLINSLKLADSMSSSITLPYNNQLTNNNNLHNNNHVYNGHPSINSTIYHLSKHNHHHFGAGATLSSPLSISNNNNGKQIEGPDGSNLFIYHLPAEYSDYDLITLFTPFGNVISAKVFIDKNSNLSKCFGFVSFDNPESAQNAIRSMNGFQILNKRLKVQLKKVRDKPY